MLENKIYKNIPILNSLRFFAAFSVCVFHFVCTTNGLIYNELIIFIFDHGKYGVQMFFVISGFVIPWSMYNSNYKINKIFKFLLKRFLRLEPPYIISMILFISIILTLRIGLNIFDVQFSLEQILLHFGYLIPFFEGFKWLNDVYWSLAIEFQYYLLISILFPLFIHSNSIYRYILYFLFLSLSINSNFSFIFYWLPIFLMGIIIFLKFIEKIKIIEFYSLLLLLTIWVIYFYGIACGVFSIVTVILILYFKNNELKTLSFLGEFSYSLYLIHNFTGAILINLLSPYMINLWQKLLLLIFSLVISYILAWVMFILIEKPSKKWSATIKY